MMERRVVWKHFTAVMSVSSVLFLPSSHFWSLVSLLHLIHSFPSSPLSFSPFLCLSLSLFSIRLSPRPAVDQCQQDTFCSFLLRFPEFLWFIVASRGWNYLLLPAVFQQLPCKAELGGWSFRGDYYTLWFSYVCYYSFCRWQTYIIYKNVFNYIFSMKAVVRTSSDVKGEVHWFHVKVDLLQETLLKCLLCL